MKRTYNFWVVVRPAEDLPGQWVAHCLDLDVVSQGTSLQHAVEMVGEAIGLTAVEDLIASRDPLIRRAPEEFWADLYTLLREGKKVENPSELLSAKSPRISALVGQMEITIERERQESREPKSASSKARSRAWELPAVWARDGGTLLHA